MPTGSGRAPREAPTGLSGRARSAFLAGILAEDRVGRDATTRAVLTAPLAGVGIVTAEARGVLSGGALAADLARAAGLRATVLVRDGARVAPREAVLELRGDVRRILGVERAVLNLVMHLSGVATATHRAVRAAGRGRHPLAIYATRKTLPLLRDLEKQAVRDGGGHAHRRDLSDQLLLKNNHLALVPVAEAVRRARRRYRRTRVLEVEVRSVAEALAAARAGADALLLDNRTPRAARAIVAALERAGLRRSVWIELSGGLSERNLARYTRVGADAASLGAITHSAPALPFHLRLRRAARSHAARRVS